MSDIIEFGFDDAQVIKNQGLDRFKLSTSEKAARISLVAFKTYYDVVYAKKAKEKGSALTEDEKQDLYKKITVKLSEQLKKSESELTEVDRLDIQHPKFLTSFTHYKDGVGMVRCLSKYNGTTLVKPDVCCSEMGDAEQQVGTIVIKYPYDKQTGDVDMDLFKLRKYTEFNTFRMNAKKFLKVQQTIVEAKKNGMPVIDLKITLDGDQKYQKFQIENGYIASWSKEDVDPEVRKWVLESGIRNLKYVKNELGFEMSREKLLEKLRGASASAASLSDGEASASAPKLQGSYTSLID